MKRTGLMLSITFLSCLMLAARGRGNEPDDHLQARERQSQLQLMEAEFDVKMHEIGLAISELAVEAAKLEIDKVEEHVAAAQRREDPNPRALAHHELGQARIRFEMQKLQLEMKSLELERARARMQIRKSHSAGKNEKRHQVRVEYVDDLDIVILRGPKEAVDKIKTLIESAGKAREE